MMNATETIQKCKTILQSYYGSQFQGVVFYGSVANHQATAGSDIDLLVLLDKPFDYVYEIRQIIELLYPIQLESEQLLSVKPARLDEFEKGATQLYRHIKQEGLTV